MIKKYGTSSETPLAATLARPWTPFFSFILCPAGHILLDGFGICKQGKEGSRSKHTDSTKEFFLLTGPVLIHTLQELWPIRKARGRNRNRVSQLHVMLLPFQSWKWSASLLCSLLLLEIVIFSVLWVRVHDDGIHERKQKLLSAKNRWPLTILIPNHSLSTVRVLKVSSLCSSSSLSRLSWLSLGPSVPVFSFTALATPILCAATIDSRIVWIGSCRTASFASNHASLLLLLLSFNCTTYL